MFIPTWLVLLLFLFLMPLYIAWISNLPPDTKERIKRFFKIAPALFIIFLAGLIIFLVLIPEVFKQISETFDFENPITGLLNIVLTLGVCFGMLWLGDKFGKIIDSL